MYKRKKKFCLAALAVLMLILGFVPVSGQRQWPGTLLAHAAAKPSMNVKKVTLSVGGSQQLVLNGTNTVVKWSSSNKKIATVSAKGLVTAKKKGKATITAKAGKKTCACTVTVKQPVKSLSLNKRSTSLAKGKTVTLKAQICPANANQKGIVWTTSDSSVAKVNSKGKVTAVSAGSCIITAAAKENPALQAACEITVPGSATTIHATGTPTPGGATYKVSGKTVTVSGNGWTRKYKNYSQLGIGNYYPPYGCVITAVATAASGYGKTYTPKQLHEGAASRTFSERYALKRLGASLGLYGKAAISVRTASQILTDMGIANTPVYSFDADTAIVQITANLKAGRPVLIKTNNNNHSGVKIANSHHAIVLVGIDRDGYAILLEPVGGKVNYVHGGKGKSCKMTVEDLVRYHMDPATEAGMRSAYVTSVAGAGGYILLG